MLLLPEPEGQHSWSTPGPEPSWGRERWKLVVKVWDEVALSLSVEVGGEETKKYWGQRIRTTGQTGEGRGERGSKVFQQDDARGTPG